MLVVLLGCTKSLNRSTGAQALAAAEPAMKTKFPDGFEADRPYHAACKDGTWWAHGTIPGDTMGGTAEALVADGSGKVLRV